MPARPLVRKLPLENIRCLGKSAAEGGEVVHGEGWSEGGDILSVLSHGRRDGGSPRACTAGGGSPWTRTGALRVAPVDAVKTRTRSSREPFLGSLLLRPTVSSRLYFRASLLGRGLGSPRIQWA